MKLGVTGSRTGFTEPQRKYYVEQLYILNQANELTWINHGDCVGVDASAHELGKRAGFQTHAFPPDKDTHRAFKKADVIEKPAGYLARDRAIVRASERVLGFPSGPEADQPRSGTWYTIRYAIKSGVPTTVVMPDGSYEHYNIVKVK